MTRFTKQKSKFLRLAPLACTASFCLFVGYIALDGKVHAQGGDPASVMELIESLKMTEEQKAKFQEQENLRLEFQAKRKELKGAERQAAQEAFQKKRRAALEELFTEEQWKQWNGYWTTHWNRQTKEDPTPPQPETPLVAPDFEKASGRFQVAKKNDRISLITPDGDAFFSLGVTHIVAMGSNSAKEPNLLADHYDGNWSAMAFLIGSTE